MKILLLIIDGLGDERIPDLNNKTPLESAKTPNLDKLAKEGACGLLMPYFEKGKSPTSEDCHLALFGYNPKKYNPGRGVLEVLGLGFKVLPEDICLRGNFATLDENFKIIDRRAGRIKETLPLIRGFCDIKIEGVKIILKKGLDHRLGIILRGKNLSEKVRDGDIKKLNITPLKIQPKEKTKKAQFTAKILNEFLKLSHQILKEHPLNKKRQAEGRLPANFILLRGAGRLKKVISFQEKYKMKACCIAGAPLYKGIAKYLGMKIIEVKGATGLPNTNLKGKIKSALKALQKFDFVFLHIKAADNFAEDGDFLGKKIFIEKIDKCLKILFTLKNTLIVITGDHSTCSLQKSHCKKPIPLLIWGKGADKIEQFSERACQKGKLGKVLQKGLMREILKLTKNCST